jgi:hypothetical protein
MVKLVINIPKLPLLTADQMPITKPVKNIGYTINNGGVGTVSVKITATDRFSSQFTVSNINLSLLLAQSFLIN